MLWSLSPVQQVNMSTAEGGDANKPEGSVLSPSQDNVSCRVGRMRLAVRWRTAVCLVAVLGLCTLLTVSSPGTLAAQMDWLLKGAPLDAPPPAAQAAVSTGLTSQAGGLALAAAAADAAASPEEERAVRRAREREDRAKDRADAFREERRLRQLEADTQREQRELATLAPPTTAPRGARAANLVLDYLSNHDILQAATVYKDATVFNPAAAIPANVWAGLQQYQRDALRMLRSEWAPASMMPAAPAAPAVPVVAPMMVPPVAPEEAAGPSKVRAWLRCLVELCALFCAAVASEMRWAAAFTLFSLKPTALVRATGCAGQGAGRE